MSASLNDLQPALRPFAEMLVKEAGRVGYMPRVTSTRRSNASQQRLYREYLAGRHAYPVARPGTSAHEYGWALDMVLSPMEALSDAGAYWEALGGVWGGRPRRAGSGYDPIHFEYPNWRSYVDWASPDVRQQKDDAHSESLPWWTIFAPTVVTPTEGSSAAAGGSIIRKLEDLFRF